MQIFCLFVRLWGDLSETRIYNNIFSCKCACVIVWQLPLGVAPPTRCCQLFCTLSLLYFRLLSDWITRPDDKRWNNVRGPFTTGIVANERQSLWWKYKSNACQTQEINFYHLFSRQRKEDRRCRKSCQSLGKQSKIRKYSLKLYSIQRIPKLCLAHSANSLTNFGDFSLKAANWFSPVAELRRKAIRITETKCIILYRWTLWNAIKKKAPGVTEPIHAIIKAYNWIFYNSLSWASDPTAHWNNSDQPKVVAPRSLLCFLQFSLPSDSLSLSLCLPPLSLPLFAALLEPHT